MAEALPKTCYGAIPLKKNEFIQRGLEYWRENKYEQLVAERRKFDYMYSGKHVSVACEKNTEL
jgi:hypothetical protein